MTSATESLCVGAHFDHRFRSRVLRDVYAHGRRALAPSYGFDAVEVLRHCRRARAWAYARHVLLCLVLGASVLTGVLNTAAAALLLALWGLVVGLGWVLALAVGVRGRVAAWARVVVSVAAFAALCYWYLRFGLPWAHDRAAERVRLDDLAPPSDVVVIAVVLALFAVVAVEAVQRQVVLGRVARGRDHRARTRRLAQFAERQGGNVTVYSAATPFLGAGQELRTWSFALRLVRPGRSAWFSEGDDRVWPASAEYDTVPFTVHELVDRVREQFGTLTAEPDPAAGLPGLVVRDHVFVAAWGAERPIHTMTPGQVRAVVADPTRAARHQLVCQVRSGDGEVVTTVFVHLALQGRTLYVELSARMLPPTRPGYRARSTGAGAGLDALGRALLALPRLVALAPLGVLLAGRAALRRILRTSTADFGALVSIRELGAAGPVPVHPDVVKHWKILERRVLATIFDFLQGNGVDTVELTARAQTVLNGGVAPERPPAAGMPESRSWMPVPGRRGWSRFELSR